MLKILLQTSLIEEAAGDIDIDVEVGSPDLAYLRRRRALVAPRDTYGLPFAVVPRHRYVLRGAARHIWSFRRRDSRRISMCPIPGNIMFIRVMDIARCWLRNVYGFAIG
jgi:hypothetical protein